MARKPIRVYKKTGNDPVDSHRREQVYRDGSDVDRLSITQQVLSHPEHYSVNAEASDNPKYQSLLHSIYDAVIITDSVGNIRESNGRAEQNFLRPNDELADMNILDLISGADGELLKIIRKNVTNKKFTVLEAVCVRGDGSRFHAEIVINRLMASDSRTLCFFVRDITVRKEAENELRDANERLVEAEKVQARVDTLSTLFYELNNPLQILSCMAELDENKEYNNQLSRVVEVLNRLRQEEPFEPIVDENGESRYDIAVQEELSDCDYGKLLVVDDDDVLRNMFVSTISHSFPDLEIECASNGQQAVDLFSQNHHGLIIMDVSMPILNGELAFEKIDELSRIKNLKTPSCIFFTGFLISDNLKEIVGDGSFHCYLSKPITMADMIEAVRSRLSFRQEPAELQD